MPHYMPQPMPQREPGHSARPVPPQPHQASCEIVTQAAALGRSVRQEQGMQGLRRYVKAMRPFLQTEELAELAKLLGVPCPPQEPEHKPVQQASAPQNQHQPMNSLNNMAQLLQLFSQFSGGMNQSGGNPGMNPMMLAQLMNAMNGGGS